MALTFTVEDGTGVTGANAYIETEYADDYIAIYAPTADAAAWDALSDDQKERSIMIATAYIDKTYTFKGAQLLSTQGLQWPRVGVFDSNGYWITGVPDVPVGSIKKATAEYAYRAAQSNLIADPTISQNGAITYERVGDIEVHYQGSFTNIYQGTYPSADAYVAYFINAFSNPKIIRG